MKFLTTSLVTLIMALLFICCKKDVEAPSVFEGRWNGLYGNDNETPSIIYKLNIKRGGAIEEINFDGQVKGMGNWTLTGNLFTAHYQWKAPLNTVFTLTATYNPATNRLTGTWGFDSSTNDGGKWDVSRSN